MEEKKNKSNQKNRKRQSSLPTRLYRLNEISPRAITRIGTGIDELDRVLGGGIVPGSLLLLGGEPGIGKSTLLLQVCINLARGKIPVLYVTGEESGEQVRLRAQRLGNLTDELYLLCSVDMEEIIAAVEKTKSRLLVVDSIQTLINPELTSPPGSVAQVRECTGELLKMAKTYKLSVFIIGHVTKFGAIAGPKTLEHMVDTVLYFEGESTHNYRVVRAVKNRYGPTNEIGVFEMRETGLVGISNPSEFFLAERRPDTSGSAVVVTVEGTRPLLVEVQALAAPTPFPLPQRVSNGFDLRRLTLLLGILERRTNINIGNRDIFLNIAGGLKLTEPAVDLGVICALSSAIVNIPLPKDTVFIGEVGLAGEIRSVAHITARLTEARRLGFKKALLPILRNQPKINGLTAVTVDSVNTALLFLKLKK